MGSMGLHPYSKPTIERRRPFQFSRFSMHSSTISVSDCGDSAAALPVDEALRRMLRLAEPLEGYEYLGLSAALGRVLYQPVVSLLDVPTHANSAVDGYAVRGEDLPAAGRFGELAVIGTVRAGHPFTGMLGPGQSVRIMTGAPIPAGADTVLMQEQVEARGDRIGIGSKHRCGENVRSAGEDLRKGETVLPAGRLLIPPDIGLLASVGITQVRVTPRPRVALISTGDELCPVGQPLATGCIYDSNRHALLAALQGVSAQVMDLGIVADDRESLRQAFLQAAQSADVVVSTGGVAVGQADCVRDVLAEVGDISVWRIAMKPGQRIAYGRMGSTVFIGLPGNPVSALIGHYLFVRPILERKMGVDSRLPIPTFPAVALERIPKKPGRTEFQRGILERGDDGVWRVRSTGSQGSGILSSMSRANALMILAHDLATVAPGEWVEVLPFSSLM